MTLDFQVKLHICVPFDLCGGGSDSKSNGQLKSHGWLGTGLSQEIFGVESSEHPLHARVSGPAWDVSGLGQP